MYLHLTLGIIALILGVLMLALDFGYLAVDGLTKYRELKNHAGFWLRAAWVALLAGSALLLLRAYLGV